MDEVAGQPLQIQAGVMEVAQWWLARARAPASGLEDELKAANQNILKLKREISKEKKPALGKRQTWDRRPREGGI